MSFSHLPISVLDLAPVTDTGSPSLTFANSANLAQLAERLGYRRYWLAEHHNMPGIASAATSLVISHVAAATSTIRVGSGGIMLFNHAPLVIAEQFGTLEALYPGRIDLGLGRAPGTDQLTSRVLRRGLDVSGEEFPGLLAELRSYLAPVTPQQKVQAIPGGGSAIPIWLLGSGGFSARLAGELGLPFASAGHFSPDNLLPGLALYRESFQASASLQQPYAMVCINVFCAETDEEAERLATSHFQAFLNLRTYQPRRLPPPRTSLDEVARAYGMVGAALPGSIVGNPARVKDGLQELLEVTKADELMVHSMIYDHSARKRSYQLLMDAIR